MSEETEKDPITLINEESANNFRLQDVKMQNYTLYGEYDYIPVPLEKRKIIDEAVNEINTIVKPTISRLDNDLNRAEIQDSIYRKIVPFISGFNVCVMNSKDIRDVNYCSDRLINFLRGEAREYTINFLKDF